MSTVAELAAALGVSASTVRRRRRGLPGLLVPTLDPGSPEWLRVMSASKVAAVLGLSPYESRWSLWHRMAGLVPQAEQTTQMTRGHLLEDAVARWWRQQYPDARVERTGTWALPIDPRMVASPDRLAVFPHGTALLEVKTAGGDDEWTREPQGIPIGYRVQVVWQMLVTGADLTHVAVLLPRLEFREYLIPYDPAEGAAVLAAAQSFLADLDAGRAPDLDAHGATFEAVRRLHPEIEDREQPVPAALADRYLNAVAGARAADAELTESKSRLLHAVGRAKHAVRDDGERIATRQPNGKHPPKLAPAERAVGAITERGEAA